MPDVPRSAWEDRSPPPPFQHNHGPMDRTMHAGRMGRWWSDPALAQKIGLNDEQQKKLDDLFQQNRLRLIDLSANLQKQEAILEPLLSADRPDETKILSQIDRIAQARAELEKSNARMLLAMRGVLTQDQWKRLQAEIPRRRGPMGR
jgi:periplasmic protein CpxP/Spy